MVARSTLWKTARMNSPSEERQPGMSGAEFIHSALKTGGERGLSGLSGAARKVWLISEAEVLSEMEGIGAFLDADAKSLPEAADAFASIGAREIAECL